ncbi:hypothetical protein CHS0354_025160 [Potamilus streckersoni]|uniref:FACT complex subunit SSRP1 n=1 Tax=Potamilus streckersoni TaxID=2493646 RepID=A0AAE0VL82_9BIVA|nr:hypothetical protein CHS0354_025160 [Potamilus streckersoni]
MSDYQEYPDVVQEVRGAMNPGRLKLQSNGVIFKNSKTGKVDHFESSDVQKVQWLKRSRGYCLKLIMQNGNIHRYDGFKDTEYDKLATFVSKNYNTSLEKVDLSTKGWNWGLAKFEGNSLNFLVDNVCAFEIPLNNVSHSVAAKNEVTIEFHQNDDAAVSLTELRFHIPSDNTDKDPVQEFYNNVIQKADIIQATGDAITIFNEVQCLTPRGRYDIKMYPTFLQLHGKTFDYKIPYTTVLRLFLLPHKDGRQIFFVVSLDPPIKQGQTRYHFLILLFSKDDEITMELGLSEDDLQKKYEGKLEKEMSGPEYEVVSRIFKSVTNRKITVPGSFKGNSGTPAISCSYRAATGLLYPLERGFIFVHKPPVHIRFDEISTVNFARSAGSTRSFDFDVETKTGTVYTFSSIEKDEYGKLFDFVSGKKLRVKNIGGKGGMSSYAEDMMDSDEDDNHDAYMVRMKAEGKEREEEEDMNFDSDDSSDVSFNPGSLTGSEVAEEYDSNPPSTDSSYSIGDYSGGSGSESDSGSDAEERQKRREKDKEKRKSKSAKTVHEGPRKPRKKKKDVDPDKPKRPATAYFLWFMESRENIKKENPELSITELSKKAGAMWKELNEETKGEYEKKAEEAKKEYQLAMEEYKKKLKDEGKEVGGGDSSASKKRSPKKSVTDSRAGAGSDYKSKEFISSSEDTSEDDDKPLKKKAKDKNEDEEDETSDEEAELPDDEEILSTPPSSGKEDSESETGSGEGSESE